jgi:tetratricopeptide (TPR) repeat protein
MGRLANHLLGSVLLSTLLAGCGFVQGLIGGGGAEGFAAGEAALKAGDLPGAVAAWEENAAANPADVDSATGAAFAALLKGDAAAADAALAAAEEGAGERLPELKLRRALVALRGGQLDAARTHGEASGRPEGKLIAAEVLLADGERDQAKALLEGVAGAGGALGATAQGYLDLMSAADPAVVGLSEATALWALGERKVAVRSAEELVKSLPDEQANRGELLLVWAGRAASVGETESARGMIDALTFAPEGQQWRKLATLAIVSCAEGDGATCSKQLKSLEGQAPSDGLADARATAAFLLASKDADAAREIAGSTQSYAAARALLEAGDAAGAAAASPAGAFAEFLKAGG